MTDQCNDQAASYSHGTGTPLDTFQERVRGLDRRLVAAARSIKVLSRLTWPATIGEQFLADWRRGCPSIPKPPIEPVDLANQRRELDGIAAECDASHPLEDFLRRTARSYSRAAELIEARGTRRFRDISILLYGSASDPVTPGGAFSTEAAAQRLLQLTAGYVESCGHRDDDYCLLATTVAEELRRAVDAVFVDEPVAIVLDPSLVAKAAAGASRIRLRDKTCFSRADVKQLIHQEAMVHTLTARNGKLQPLLTSLELGAPRTTRTQEGLALFAELITNSIDVGRLRRIAARCVAVGMASNGANFVEVFRFFLSCGQTDLEAYASAGRVFRGGDPNGGVAFTKDVVYLQGLARVHAFLRDAVRSGRFDDGLRIFSGRLRLGDIERLRPCFDDGTIIAPHYRPAWVHEQSTLVAFLLYAGFADILDLHSLAAPTEDGV